MHILAIIIAVVGGAAFWWWRMKMVSEAANEITDVAGRAWGKYKRAKFRRKAESSAVDAVEDPVAAATVMMLAIAKTDGPMSDRAEKLITDIAANDLGVEDTTELMTFTKWVVGHVTDANDVSRRYAKLWANALNVQERRDLVSMVQRVAEVDGHVSHEKSYAVSKLNERLGLAG
jgi:uncharacterized tellurite resistance protein B-like protein